MQGACTLDGLQHGYDIPCTEVHAIKGLHKVSHCRAIL